MRQDQAAEATGIAVIDACIAGELVPRPQDEGHASGLEEHCLLDFLAVPAEPFVERPGPAHVRDPERDQADTLLHHSNLTDATRRHHGEVPGHAAFCAFRPEVPVIGEGPRCRGCSWPVAERQGGALIYSVRGLVIFAGFTMFDFQRLRRSQDITSAPFLAASIFLDVPNVFLFFLTIFSSQEEG